MRRQARLRPGPPPHDLQIVVRGGPVDLDALEQQMGDAAAIFSVQGRPMHGFSVEGLDSTWDLERVLREGRVRHRRTFTTCTVGELRTVGCQVLPTFGVEPPHYTVLVKEDRETLERVVALMRRRLRPNPHRVSR